MLRFRFDEKATVQAAAYLLKKYKGQRHGLYCLIKMIYFADRTMLIRYGQTITGSKLCAMQHGPVPSEVYNEAKGETQSNWPTYITRIGDRTLALKQSPGADHLSRAATAILDEVYREYGALDFKQMRRRAHALPEHQDTLSSHRIDPAFILRSAGVPDEDIRTIEQTVTEFNEAQAALA